MNKDLPAHPQITLSFAQSLDACITREAGRQTILSGPGAQKAVLTEAGAVIFHVPCDQQGLPLLTDILSTLAAQGVKTLMVEGGARIIHSFIRHRLADRLVITVAPLIMGGLNPYQDLPQGQTPLKLHPVTHTILDGSCVIDGCPAWEQPPV